MVLIAHVLSYVLLACTAIFLAVTLRGSRQVMGGGTQSTRSVRLAVLAQMASFGLAWAFRRPRVNPFGGEALWPDVLIAVFCLAPAVGAILLAAAAKRQLGRYWAFAARVVQDHKLVTAGPFGFVRHPIYLGMGMLIAGPIIGRSSWPGVVGAILLFAVGTAMRIRAEDALLAETFGAEFDEYRRRVPAFLPRPWRQL